MELKSGTKLKGRTFGLEYQAAKVRNTIKLRRNRKKCREKLKGEGKKMKKQNKAI